MPKIYNSYIKNKAIFKEKCGFCDLETIAHPEITTGNLLNSLSQLLVFFSDNIFAITIK